MTSAVFLLTRCYGPDITLGKTPTNPENLTLRNNMIKSLDRKLPKYFSQVHKAKPRELTSLVLKDKLSAQFISICSQLIEDNAVTDNTKGN